MTRRERERKILAKIQDYIDTGYDVRLYDEPIIRVEFYDLDVELVYQSLQDPKQDGGRACFGPDWNWRPLTLKRAREIFTVHQKVPIRL